MSEATHLERGMRVTVWKLVPWTVHGGWRVALARWVHDGEDWDQEHDWTDDATIYPTEAECRAAIPR
jgi:hypothetical protein